MEIGARVWIPALREKDKPYFLGTLASIDHDRVLLHTKSQGKVSVKREDVSLANDAQPRADLAELIHLSEPAVLANTIERAKHSDFFTWVGPGQLISINGCDPKHLQGQFEPIRMRSFHGKSRMETGLSSEPHAFALAEEACIRLKQGRPCAILVAGESGSGKVWLHVLPSFELRA